MFTALLVFGGVAIVATLLLILSAGGQHVDERQVTVIRSDVKVEQQLSDEINKLRLLLVKQQQAAAQQSQLMVELQLNFSKLPRPDIVPQQLSRPTPTALRSTVFPPDMLTQVGAAERQALAQASTAVVSPLPPDSNEMCCQVVRPLAAAVHRARRADPQAMALSMR